jgi:hypothetical protein
MEITIPSYKVTKEDMTCVLGNMIQSGYKRFDEDTIIEYTRMMITEGGTNDFLEYVINDVEEVHYETARKMVHLNGWFNF